MITAAVAQIIRSTRLALATLTSQDAAQLGSCRAGCQVEASVRDCRGDVRAENVDIRGAAAERGVDGQRRQRFTPERRRVDGRMPAAARCRRAGHRADVEASRAAAGVEAAPDRQRRCWRPRCRRRRRGQRWCSSRRPLRAPGIAATGDIRNRSTRSAVISRERARSHRRARFPSITEDADGHYRRAMATCMSARANAMTPGLPEAQRRRSRWHPHRNSSVTVESGQTSRRLTFYGAAARMGAVCDAFDAARRLQRLMGGAQNTARMAYLRDAVA